MSEVVSGCRMDLLRFQLTLPEEVMKIPCHITWIKEFIPQLERTAMMKENIKDLPQYLRSVLRGNFRKPNNAAFSSRETDAASRETDDAAGGSNENSNPTWKSDPDRDITIIGFQLNKAAFRTYLGHFRSVRYHLERVKKIVAESTTGNEELQGDRIDVVQYCVDAIELAMKNMKDFEVHAAADDDNSNKMEQKSMPEEGAGDVEDRALEMKRLLKKWEQIQFSRESKATVAFLQGLLAKDLKIKKTEVLWKFEEAAKLDPDYHVWNHYAYRYMRGSGASKKKWNVVAREQEYNYCKKAYELRPDYLPVLVDYARLQMDLMMEKPESEWEVEDVKNCDELFKNALQASKDNGADHQKFWLRKLKIDYAEFLVFGKHPSLDQLLGKKMFVECVEENPNDQYLLHKVAKMLHQGGYSFPELAQGREMDEEKRGDDLEKAEEYYQRALKIEWTYHCFTDYLKLLQDFGIYEDIVKAFDEFPSTSGKDSDDVSLLVDRGCVIWLCNPNPTTASKEDACQSWIQALMECPDRANYVYGAFSCVHKVGDRRPTRIWKQSVIDTLEQMKTTANSMDEMKAIILLVNELRQQQKVYGTRTRTQNRFTRLNNYHGQVRGNELPQDGAHDSNGRGMKEGGRSRQNSVDSVADRDVDWRRGSVQRQPPQTLPASLVGFFDQPYQLPNQNAAVPFGNGGCLYRYRTPQTEVVGGIHTLNGQPFNDWIGLERGRAHFCAQPVVPPRLQSQAVADDRRRVKKM